MSEAAVSDSSDPGERCSRMYEFKFEDNSKFLEGWNKIIDIVPESQQSDAYLKAQVYFYSREVEHIDLEQYRKWLTDNNKQLMLPDAEAMKKVSERDEQTEASSTKADAVTAGAEAAVGGEAGRHPGSFAELIAMVHNGIPLPDTDGEAIEPTNEEPSSPVMQRLKKPWEVDVN